MSSNSTKLGSICLIAALVMMTVPWFLAGLKIWGWLFLGIAALVLLTEWYSIKHNGKTISSLFGDFYDSNPKTAVGVLLSVSCGWLALVAHLVLS